MLSDQEVFNGIQVMVGEDPLDTLMPKLKEASDEELDAMVNELRPHVEKHWNIADAEINREACAVVQNYIIQNL